MQPNMNIRTTLTPLPNSYQQESHRKMPKPAQLPAYIEAPETLPGIKIHHFWRNDSHQYAHLPYYRQKTETEYLPMLGESWVFKPRDMITTTTTTTTTSTTTTTTSPASSPPTPLSTPVASRTSTPRPITPAAKLGMNAVNKSGKRSNSSCSTTSNSRIRRYLSSAARSAGTGLCRMADMVEGGSTDTGMPEERYCQSYGKDPKACDEGCIWMYRDDPMRGAEKGIRVCAEHGVAGGGSLLSGRPHI